MQTVKHLATINVVMILLVFKLVLERVRNLAVITHATATLHVGLLAVRKPVRVT